MLRGKAGDPGGRGKDNRLFIEAVLWIFRTGPVAKSAQHFALTCHAVYVQFGFRSRTGVSHRAFLELSKDDEFARRVYPDSTIVRAHQHAAGAPKKRRAGPCRSRGGLTIKIHALVRVWAS